MLLRRSRTARAREFVQVPFPWGFDARRGARQHRNLIAQRAAGIAHAVENLEIQRHDAAEMSLPLAREMVLDLFLVRIERVEKHPGGGGGFLRDDPAPRRACPLDGAG